MAKIICPRCKRRVDVLNPNPGKVTPWIEKHRLGKACDRKGGETPRTVCDCSFVSVGAAELLYPS